MRWRSLSHNLGWKLVSLAVAVFLWSAILGEPEVVTSRTVPIVYKNLSPDLLIASDAIDRVRADFRGPASRLTPERLADATVELDLETVTGPGERTFTLSDSDFRLPEGVGFDHAVPSQLRIRFARTLERDVPVQIRVAGAPPSGYRVVGQEVTPRTLRVSGPEDRVVAIKSVGTDEINLANFKQTATVPVDAFVDDPQIRLVSSASVAVKITIEETGKTK